MENKLITTKIIAKACKKTNLDFTFATANKTVLAIKLKDKTHYIINSNLGLITNTEAHICLDKAYQHEILSDVINISKTISYLDPFSKFGEFSEYKSHQEIVGDITDKFSFPLIVKKNTGTEGENVFLCNNANQVSVAVNNIFNLDSYLYDHVLIAQQRINIKEEYRAIFYKNNLELLYKKDISQAQYTGNLSPLHYEGSKAVDIDDSKFQQKISDFISPIFKKINLSYAGFDIAEDQSGKLYLIEINSIPGYAHYLANNPEDKLFNLFTKILTDLKK
ncbi:MAG: alpha-L-glutamate ligase [Candidatus Pacebacteria bacterium]|nr:alpha-L-glutamate ligase [Candidatus Paceibacterota bacterium]